MYVFSQTLSSLWGVFQEFTRHVHKIRSPRRWSSDERFMRNPATLACSLAPPLQISTKPNPWWRSVLIGQTFIMELPLASPTRCELHAVIRFLSAKDTTPIYIHRQLCEVHESQCKDVKTCESGSESSCTDFHDKQRSGWPSVSAKTIAKVEQEMLEDWHVIVRKLCERIPEVSKSTIGNMAGKLYDKGIWKMPQRMQKCINRNSD